jgi:GTPase SAR1 family protein
MGTSAPSLGKVISNILKAVANFTRAVGDSLDTVVDFAYVKVFGLPFIVLGYRQTGKTTLIEWLRQDLERLEEFNPEPTAAGGESVAPFTTRIGPDGTGLRVKARRDVGGEYAMWDTDWVDLFQQTRPRGIIFLIDHTNVYQHKDALNFVLQMLDDEESARRHVKTFMLLVNKMDLWEDETSEVDILDRFRNEVRRLKSQSERLGYRYTIHSTSLLNGAGVEEAMAEFFNVIRPRPQ